MSVLSAATRRFLDRQLSPRVSKSLSDALDAASAAVLVPTATKTTDQVAAFGDLVVFDATGGNLTCTAPDPVGNAGKRWGMKLLATASSHTITAAPHAAEAFDAGTGPSTATPGAAYVFTSDGTRWIVSHTGP